MPKVDRCEDFVMGLGVRQFECVRDLESGKKWAAGEKERCIWDITTFWLDLGSYCGPRSLKAGGDDFIAARDAIYAHGTKKDREMFKIINDIRNEASREQN